MQEVAISEFKAKCLARLEQVRVTKRPFRVTRFGKPVAELLGGLVQHVVLSPFSGQRDVRIVD